MKFCFYPETREQTAEMETRRPCREVRKLGELTKGNLIKGGEEETQEWAE